MHMSKFIVNGGKPLRGTVKIGGSKNAALPILAATLLTDQKCVLRNVPDIEDVRTMLQILRSLGSEVRFKNNVVTIQTRKINHKNMEINLCCRMRASVLLLGPLLAREHYARLPYPGGCIIGARPVDTHIDVLGKLNVKRLFDKPGRSGVGQNEIILSGNPRATRVVLPEFSVTATENVIMAASRTLGETQIRLAAIEPHIQDLCVFLEKMGVDIWGIGTHSLRICGKKNLRGAKHTIAPDYLETGTLVIAAILTRGNVLIKNIVPKDLDALWNLLHEMGIKFELGKDTVKITPTGKWRACKRLQTNIFPGFPTDLQPPFVILLTQAHGEAKIHEALFEGRFKYMPELKTMGAKIEILNEHEAKVLGPSKLHGGTVKSWDLRAGAAMILAALSAKGKTIITDISYIDRGYEKFDEKLRALGADIVRK